MSPSLIQSLRNVASPKKLYYIHQQGVSGLAKSTLFSALTAPIQTLGISVKQNVSGVIGDLVEFEATKQQVRELQARGFQVRESQVYSIPPFVGKMEIHKK